jgi:cell division septation protein DedD
MRAQLSDREGANVLRFDPPVRKAEAELPEPIRLIVSNLGVGVEADLIRGTFASLMELLDDLQNVEAVGSQAAHVEESVAAFASVHDKALDLVAHVEQQVLLIEDISKSPGSELLDVSFALRHELRRAFDLDIAEIDGGRPFESAEGRVAHAHGVLRNCFRQCVVMLAQAFEPASSERTVFADAASRLEESILLRDALSALLDAVQEAVKKSFPQSAVSVIEQLDVFRRDGMPFLMRRDWEMFDAFENDIVAAKDAGEFDYAAKKLLVGLETLLGQVRMRSVFSDERKGAPAPRRFDFKLARRLTAVRPATWSAVAASLLLACGLAFFVDTAPVTRGSQLAADAAQPAVNATTEQAALATKESAKPAAPVKPVEAAKPAEAAKPVAEAKPAAPAKAEEKKSVGGLTLQVGAFRDGAAASQSVAKLKTLGVEARVTKAQKDGQTIYRVQVGNFAGDADAERFGRQLRAKGIAQSFIVTKVG